MIPPRQPPLQTERGDTLAQTSLAVGIALLLVGLGDKLRDLMNFQEMFTPHWIGEFLVNYGGTVAALIGAWLRKPPRKKSRLSDSQFFELTDLIDKRDKLK